MRRGTQSGRAEGILTATALCLLLFSAAAAGDIQGPPAQPLLLVGSSAYFPAPDWDVVVPPQVSQAEWSPDGRFVLGVRRQSDVARLFQPGSPGGAISLVLWSQKTRRTKTVWRSAAEQAPIVRFWWLPQGTAAVAEMQQLGSVGAQHASVRTTPSRWLARVDPRRARLQAVARLGVNDPFAVSATGPYAAWFDLRAQVLRIIGGDGWLRRVITLPRPLRQVRLEWAATGDTVLIRGVAVEAQAAAKSSFAVEVRTGKVALLEPVAMPQAAENPSNATLPYRLQRSTVHVAEASLTLRALWLVPTDAGRRSRVLLSANSRWGKLSPAGDAVLYENEGAAIVRSIAKLPAATVVRAFQAAQQHSVESRARRIGLALLMYAQDNDGELPGDADDVRGLLKRYGVPEAASAGLTYTHPGGPLSANPDAAHTELGYLTGPGGRAVIYANGLVKWRDD